MKKFSTPPPEWLPLQPEGVLRIDGALLLAVAQAEVTVAVALVGKVHVQRALVFIGDGHTLSLLIDAEEPLSVFHGQPDHFLLVQPLHLAIFSATRWTLPESLRLPRKGSGVR